MNEEKRCEIIHDALNYLDDEMIEEVEKLRGSLDETNESECVIEQDATKVSMFKRIRFQRKWIALAASFCVLIAGSWMFINVIHPKDMAKEQKQEPKNGVTQYGQPSDEAADDEDEQGISDLAHAEESREESLKQEDYAQSSPPCQSAMTESLDESQSGVTIPKVEVNLAKPDGLESDMLGFFIHEGRCYIQYEFQHDYAETDADFVGDCVGTIHGLIDEWTPTDGYVEGAGTYTGKIYEVKGIDPEFMLCMVWDDGAVETFIHYNGITLYKGSELIDDRLHLRDNLEDILWWKKSENPYEKNSSISLPTENQAVLQQFLDAFAEEDFVYLRDKTIEAWNYGSLESYDFYLTTEHGVRLRFRLLGDGYVDFPWLHGVGVQIDKTIYNDLVEMLEANAS